MSDEWEALLTDLVLVGAVITPGTVSWSWLLESCSGEEGDFVCSWKHKTNQLDNHEQPLQCNKMTVYLVNLLQDPFHRTLMHTWEGVEASASSLRVTSKLSNFSFSTLHCQTERIIFNHTTYLQPIFYSIWHPLPKNIKWSIPSSCFSFCSFHYHCGFH